MKKLIDILFDLFILFPFYVAFWLFFMLPMLFGIAVIEKLKLREDEWTY